MTAASQYILSDSKRRRLLVLIATVLLSCVHLILKPFQMAHYSTYDYLVVNAAYIIISAVILSSYLILFPFISPQNFKSIHRSRSGRLVYATSIISSIGIGFFLFKISSGYYAFTFERVATGIAALSGLGGLSFLLFLISDRLVVPKINTDGQIHLNEKYGTISTESFFYAYSDKNYIVWVYELNGEITSSKTRETLKSVKARISNNEVILQSHRAYLVNPSKIQFVEKNQSSKNIVLNGCKDSIPLSRSFYKEFDQF